MAQHSLSVRVILASEQRDEIRCPIIVRELGEPLSSLKVSLIYCAEAFERADRYIVGRKTDDWSETPVCV
jgi:hypothetical protein